MRICLRAYVAFTCLIGTPTCCVILHNNCLRETRVGSSFDTARLMWNVEDEELSCERILGVVEYHHSPMIVSSFRNHCGSYLIRRLEALCARSECYMRSFDTMTISSALP